MAESCRIGGGGGGGGACRCTHPGAQALGRTSTLFAVIQKRVLSRNLTKVC